MSDLPTAAFSINQRVIDRARRYGVGQVIAEPNLDGGEWWYEVRFDGGREMVLSQDHLEAHQEASTTVRDLALSGRWGTLEAFRRAVAVERIRKEGNNRSTVYSFNAQRILFQPHQYKPLLRFLDSEDRRLLIADEVGLGKTIEAGLVLSELEARQSPDKVLVVCPSRLIEKWWEEMNRKFGQSFEAWRRDDVHRYARAVQQNPMRSRMRAILSMQSIRNPELRDSLLEACGQIDLLVVDEAHHARNRGTQTHKMLEDLAEASGAVLLLTATPIHLGSEDLFNQLQTLHPREYRQPEAFDRALRRSEGVLDAIQHLRPRDPARLPRAADAIERSMGQELFQEGQPELVGETIRRLREEPPQSTREWIELERDVESLHFLAPVVTRTRKRDVTEFAAQRQGEVVRVTWTQAEWALYRQMTGLQADENGWSGQPMGFGVIQRARMAASSLLGTLRWRDNSHLETVRIEEICDIDPDEDNGSAPDSEEEDGGSASADFPDSKLTALLEMLSLVDQEDSGAKVLVFTYFVGTSRYLEHELNLRGIPCLRIAGDVPANPGRPEQDERSQRVRRFASDPGVRVMVSTEVGSEGLDFQFCHWIVNYDLPWNPMVVEQRIGRVDRFGQRAPRVQIRNIVVAGTVEDRILNRLYDRIGIFERSIGPLETILGEVVTDLRREFFRGELSSAEVEERLRESERILDDKRHEMELLDQEADRFFGHEDLIHSEMDRIRHLGRYVTPGALRSVLDGFLTRYHAGVSVCDEEDGTFSLHLADGLLHDVSRRAPGPPDPMALMRRFTRDGRYRFVLDGQVAYDRQDVDLLNANHPLIKAALDGLSALLQEPVNRVGSSLLSLEEPEEGLPAGWYFVATWRMEISGVRPRRQIEATAWSVNSEEVIDDELSERLMHLVMSQGQEAPAGSSRPEMAEPVWSAMVSRIRQVSSRIETRESGDNALRRARRQQRIQEEFQAQERSVQGRISTARQRGKNMTRLMPMLEGQLQKAAARRDEAMAALEAGEHVQVSISREPLSVCAVEVRVP